MNEHDDDLESSVQEGAEEEIDDYPNTGDDLDEQTDDTNEEGEDPSLDEDDAEL